MVVIAYSFLHVGNHLLALRGVAVHISAMDSLRHIYRQPVVEAVLLFCVAFQALSGLRLVIQGWKHRTGRVAWLQAISGIYLAFFLAIHVSAVLYGRTVLGLDTNFNFAAAGFHVPPYEWFFAPYYTFAVLALFAHVGCAIYWQFQGSAQRFANVGLASALAVGVCASIAITLSLAGKLQPLTIPPAYKATYGMR
jgi:succinate dehydrogenase/fumarate reductase cytochrome b subunit